VHKTLIGYACGRGAQKQGCKDGPESFRNSSANKYKWLDIYNINDEPLNHQTAISNYCRDLCKKSAQIINSNGFPVAIGGDHSMAIGTWSGVTTALNAEGNFGLIWFDAHMDSHTPKTSLSGAYHGMPVATLMGYGDKELCSIGSDKAKISPKHLCIIGARSYESAEEELLNKLGVKVFYIDEVKKRGIEEVFSEAIAIAKKAEYFGVSIDLDAFDPHVAPATASLEKNGLLADDIFRPLEICAKEKKFRALEIAEYNPHMDKDGKTEKLIFDLIDKV